MKKQDKEALEEVAKDMIQTHSYDLSGRGFLGSFVLDAEGSGAKIDSASKAQYLGWLRRKLHAQTDALVWELAKEMTQHIKDTEE
jgi:protein required for attachment to host cells